MLVGLEKKRKFATAFGKTPKQNDFTSSLNY